MIAYKQLVVYFYSSLHNYDFETMDFYVQLLPDTAYVFDAARNIGRWGDRAMKAEEIITQFQKWQRTKGEMPRVLSEVLSPIPIAAESQGMIEIRSVLWKVERQIKAIFEIYEKDELVESNDFLVTLLLEAWQWRKQGFDFNIVGSAEGFEKIKIGESAKLSFGRNRIDSYKIAPKNAGARLHATRGAPLPNKSGGNGLIAYKQVVDYLDDKAEIANPEGKPTILVVDDTEGLINAIKEHLKDQAQIAPGGIELNAKKMGIDVAKDGKGVEIKYDAAMIAEFERRNFSGVVPVIMSIRAISSALPILGLLPRKEDEKHQELAGV